MKKKLNIGILHYQVGHTDGVSLELEKWKKEFEKLGHSVFLCAGDLGSVDGTLVEGMYHHIPEIERLTFNTFDTLCDFNLEEYSKEMHRWVHLLEKSFTEFISEHKINLLVPQNVWSVAANPAVGVALENVRRKFNLPALAHNHDFYWERKKISLTNTAVIEMMDKYYPPRDPLIKHVVINSLAKKQLAERKGILSTVVPNVFNFDPPDWQEDEFNSDFRSSIGLKENDLIILQATRVVARKGIELAINFVKTLNSPDRRELLIKNGLYNGKNFNRDSRIVLVLAGYGRDDISGTYLKNLRIKARQEGVDMIHIEDQVSHERKLNNGCKVYSLWDTYVFADFVTYPSLWEGWGNQFLEAIKAKKPILLFEYPVYKADIKSKAFEVISLGSETSGLDDLGLVQVHPDIIETAADQAVELLTNKKRRSQVVNHNFQIGKAHFSLDMLRNCLRNLLEDCVINE